jgi:hypothetical protein
MIIRGVRSSELNFSISTVERLRQVSGGESSQETIEDIIYDKYVSAVSAIEATIIISEEIGQPFIHGKTLASLDEDIATVDAEGVVTRVSDGQARITISGNRIKKQVLVPVSIDPNSIAYTFNSFAVGSIAKYLHDFVYNKISLITESEIPLAKQMFITNDFFRRNSECWLNDYKTALAAISNRNSRGIQKRCGVLITPEHVILCEHYPLYVGDTITFVDENDVSYSRTIVSTSYVGQANSVDNYATDLLVCRLSYSVPIAFAKVLPDDWGDYFPCINTTSYIANIYALASDQEKKVHLRYISNNGIRDNVSTLMDSPAQYLSDPIAKLWGETLILGDSGSPTFFIINGFMVLLKCHTTPYVGTNIANYKIEINSILSTLQSGNLLSTSSFDNFDLYWDGVGWTVAGEGATDNRTGNPCTPKTQIQAVIGRTYTISYSGITSGGGDITFGGILTSVVSENGSFNVQAISTEGLSLVNGNFLDGAMSISTLSIKENGSSYQLQEIDLSDFTNFGEA